MSPSDPRHERSSRALRAFCRDARFACESLERRTLLAAGDLDPQFGLSGIASIVNPANFTLDDLAVQQDDKSLVVGTTRDGGTYAVRLNPGGSPDTSFGTNANGVVSLSRAGFHAVSAVDVFADGRIVVAGTDTVPATGDILLLVARLLPGGSLDPSFGGGAGFVRTKVLPPDVFLSRASADDLALQADGKVVVLGHVPTYRGGGDPDNDFVVVRYNVDGSLDTGFGNNGMRLIDFEGGDFARAVAIDYTGTFATNPYWGSIVVAGEKSAPGADPQFDFAVARLTPGGDLDGSFDDNGKLITRFPGSLSSATGVVIQPGGRIVAVGFTRPGSVGQRNFALARYLPDGSLDPSFGYGGTGRVEIDFDGGDDVARGAARSFLGGIVAAGFSDTSFAAAVFTPEGRLDSRFNGDGRVTLGPDMNLGASVVGVAPGRKLVIGGGNKVARLWDVASVITIGTLNPRAFEAGPTPTSFIVGRTERLPYAERVFLNVGGTALRPGNFRRRPPDYTAAGMTFGFELSTEPTYVDIPAGQTFTTVTLTPADDTAVEGDETAVFSIAPNAFYDAASPPTTMVVIVDNETPPPPQVVARHLFYDGSAFDAGGASGADPDDAAVATDKRALLPGGTATAANISGYARGINGLMVDISNLPGDGSGVTVDSFVVHGGTGGPDVWARVAAPAVKVRPNAGLNGADRVVLNWPTAPVRNAWLRVSVLADAATGLAAPDVFYFGSLVGDTADSDTTFRVSALDLATAKRELNQVVAVTNPSDIDRSGRVNALDLATIKQNLGHSLPTLAAPAALAPVPGPPGALAPAVGPAPGALTTRGGILDEAAESLLQ